MDRRDLLRRGAAVTGGAAIAAGLAAGQAGSAPGDPTAARNGGTIDFHGAHQAGIELDPQAHQTLVAVDLAPRTSAADVQRLMRLLTDDARRLTQGRGALADLEPELADPAARLTVTFGFGPGLVAAVRGASAVPAWLAPLPAFTTIDRLQDRWSGGDLAIQVAGDDPVSVAHAVHLLVRDTRAFGTVRWSQLGFRYAAGSVPTGTTARNLFGQVDGSANVAPGSADFADVVWRDDDWLAGGTTMVVRRIAMHLDTWEKVDRTGREFAIGRRLADGSPLTGTAEHDVPDLDAVDGLGLPVIGPAAHVRRARSEDGSTHDPAERIVRRAYNYDLGPGHDNGVGLVFTTFQRDLTRQFLPIQRRLAAKDALNEWTTPIGSAVFAVPGGVTEGGYVGEGLFA